VPGIAQAQLYVAQNGINKIGEYNFTTETFNSSFISKGRKSIALERQQHVLRLAAEGATKTSIARQLGIG
jgi:DNA-binding NarL/FixJ family response regulator